MSKGDVVYRVGDCEVIRVRKGRNGKFEVRQKGRLWSVHPLQGLAEDEASRKAVVS